MLHQPIEHHPDPLVRQRRSLGKTIEPGESRSRPLKIPSPAAADQPGPHPGAIGQRRLDARRGRPVSMRVLPFPGLRERQHADTVRRDRADLQREAGMQHPVAASIEPVGACAMRAGAMSTKRRATLRVSCQWQRW